MRVKIPDKDAMAQPSISGIAWYTRDTYMQCLEIFKDADELPDSFDEWLEIAVNAERDCQRRGIRVIRAEIDPETFLAWCASHGHIEANGNARLDFANCKALEVLRSEG